jgi:transposase
MIHIGLDVHKKKTKVAVLDDKTGEIQKPYDVRTDELLEHIKKMPDPKRIAMETSTSTQFVGSEMESCGLDVMVVDAFKAHRLLEALSRSKTDKLDARGLSLLLAKGMLETARVWLPSHAVRELRELVRVRKGVVKYSVATQNRIRKFLSRQGVDCEYDDLQGKGAAKWLAELGDTLPKGAALALTVLLDSLSSTAAHIATLDEALKQQAQNHESMRLLQTIPGVGPLLAAIIMAEIGDIARFETACKLRGYTGLVPRVEQSGETHRTGPLVREANRFLRWALIQVAQNFSRSKQTQDLRVIRNYQQKVFAHGRNPAKVNLARRLTNIIFAMLRDGTEFDPAMLAHADAA